jgi:hypothetical protein
MTLPSKPIRRNKTPFDEAKWRTIGCVSVPEWKDAGSPSMMFAHMTRDHLRDIKRTLPFSLSGCDGKPDLVKACTMYCNGPYWTPYTPATGHLCFFPMKAYENYQKQPRHRAAMHSMNTIVNSSPNMCSISTASTSSSADSLRDRTRKKVNDAVIAFIASKKRAAECSQICISPRTTTSAAQSRLQDARQRAVTISPKSRLIDVKRDRSQNNIGQNANTVNDPSLSHLLTVMRVTSAHSHRMDVHREQFLQTSKESLYGLAQQ